MMLNVIGEENEKKKDRERERGREESRMRSTWSNRGDIHHKGAGGQQNEEQKQQ